VGISLCIITKNNEKTLRACLQSVENLVNERILVDTGSTDPTLKIAENFSCKIFHFKWNDNFSDAKNFALSKATNPWVLFLDADETISKKDHEKIKKLIETNKFLGFSLIQRSYTNGIGGFNWTSTKDDEYKESKIATGYIPRKMVRLFKNHTKIKFRGAIHDNVANSILKIGQIKDTNIPIHHFGYLNLSNNRKERTRYYINIEKKNYKNDFFQDCQIGTQLHEIGENEEAEKFLKKSIEKNSEFPYSWLELGIIMLEKRNFEQAKSSLHKAESLIKEPMIYNYLGVLYGMLKEYEKSIFYLKRAISFLPNNADFHYNLGLTYHKLGKNNEACEEMKKAIELNSAYKEKVKFD